MFEILVSIENKFDSETCVICLDVKQKPHYLKCNHSYCQECIQNYINTSENNIPLKCPLCRQKIENNKKLVIEFSILLPL